MKSCLLSILLLPKLSLLRTLLKNLGQTHSPAVSLVFIYTRYPLYNTSTLPEAQDKLHVRADPV